MNVLRLLCFGRGLGVDEVEVEAASAVPYALLPVAERERLLRDAYVSPSLLAPARVVVQAPSTSDRREVQNLQLDALEARPTIMGPTPSASAAAQAPASPTARAPLMQNTDSKQL
jgi:hypothetical protein